MPDSNVLYQLKVTLKGCKPPVWRRLLLKDCNLNQLHSIIQSAMGWGDCHLWEFEIDGVSYGDPSLPELEMKNADKLKLSKIVNSGVSKFSYTYDFGDSWTHSIQIEKVVEVDPNDKVASALCIKAKGACPPEDCGGVWGYMDLVQAYNQPNHEQHDDALDLLGEDFDPSACDIDLINSDLA